LVPTRLCRSSLLFRTVKLEQWKFSGRGKEKGKQGVREQV